MWRGNQMHHRKDFFPFSAMTWHSSSQAVICWLGLHSKLQSGDSWTDLKVKKNQRRSPFKMHGYGSWYNQVPELRVQCILRMIWELLINLRQQQRRCVGVSLPVCTALSAAHSKQQNFLQRVNLFLNHHEGCGCAPGSQLKRLQLLRHVLALCPWKPATPSPKSSPCFFSLSTLSLCLDSEGKFSLKFNKKNHCILL